MGKDAWREYFITLLLADKEETTYHFEPVFKVLRMLDKSEMDDGLVPCPKAFLVHSNYRGCLTH